MFVRYASFLVRIWLPDEETASGEPILRGTVEHVQSKAVKHLTRLEDVLVFLSTQISSGESSAVNAQEEILCDQAHEMYGEDEL